jgi:hypothetical protein
VRYTCWQRPERVAGLCVVDIAPVAYSGGAMHTHILAGCRAFREYIRYLLNILERY